MNAPTKLAAFGAVLALSLAGGAAVGSAVGPVDVGEPATHDDDHTDEGATRTDELPAGGLLVSQDGYTLVPEGRELVSPVHNRGDLTWDEIARETDRVIGLAVARA